MKIKPIILSLITLSALSCGMSTGGDRKDVKAPSPIQLFNGKDIVDWTPKIRLHETGENYAQTFRVEDGLLKVRYDGYEDFDQQYGHLAYNKPFGYYVLRVEYRFVESQAKGGEGWAWRNSGAMLHGQSPQSMLKDQDFPISIEGQFLGGDGTSDRTTSNLCTPGTHVYYMNELFTPHCTSSTSKTYHGDQWVTADFVVLGDSIVRHVLEGTTVLEYTKPQIGGDNVSEFDKNAKTDGKTLKEGYIYLQSESHPIDFRKVELYDLSEYKKSPEQLNNVIQQIIK
ncbi:DUF1080 domain-containing protein [Sphingobacterium alkalisoli]|uniref:DUF1080 domain-containing protein n=1 Tax=Sphingobacterium alkalisoli TaxID=1874115 RepID=A0A4U0GWE4_9SPHI|nr:DUF1080 domain-containing protein [Sphingobacterium alkalisoli]TJY63358.1 DUF1080 domain-containing protein [Sphingobacterium alkalisoli]